MSRGKTIMETIVQDGTTMAYHMFFRGVLLECDTAEEAVRLAMAIQQAEEVENQPEPTTQN